MNSQAEARVVAWAGPVPALRQWFTQGVDVHLEMAKLIGKTVQENRIKLPKNLFATKPYQEFTRKDPERQLAKNTIHGNNYGLGPRKFALITGLPEKFAGVIQDIYFSLVPEIKSGYQSWIISQLKRDRTITLPQGWKRTFYDAYGPDLERAAFAFYGQGTIGLLLIETLSLLCECFQNVSNTQGLDRLATPQNIKSRGLDVQLQVHDSVGVVCEDDPGVVKWVVNKIRELGERPLSIRGDTLTVPMDFKIGPNWGELKDYEKDS